MGQAGGAKQTGKAGKGPSKANGPKKTDGTKQTGQGVQGRKEVKADETQKPLGRNEEKSDAMNELSKYRLSINSLGLEPCRRVDMHHSVDSPASKASRHPLRSRGGVNTAAFCA